MKFERGDSTAEGCIQVAQGKNAPYFDLDFAVFLSIFVIEMGLAIIFAIMGNIEKKFTVTFEIDATKRDYLLRLVTEGKMI